MPSATLNDLFRDADQATRAGDRPRAAALLGQAIDRGLAARAPLPARSFFQLGVALYELGRPAEAETRVRQGLGKLPKDFALNNLLGVLLKNQGRHQDALAALALAEKADPKSLSPLINRGNVLLAMGDGPRSVDLYRRLVRADPRESEHLRLLGVAHRLCGELEAALRQFEAARRLAPKDDRAWVDSASVLRELERNEEAVAVIDSGIATAGNTRPLAIAKARVLLAAARHDEARAYLRSVLAADPDAAWAHYQLGRALAAFDRPQANQHLRHAVRLEPRNLDHVVALADSLDRTRGDDEAACIQEGHAVARRALALGQELGTDLLPHSRTLAESTQARSSFGASWRAASNCRIRACWSASSNVAPTMTPRRSWSTSSVTAATGPAATSPGRCTTTCPACATRPTAASWWRSTACGGSRWRPSRSARRCAGRHARCSAAASAWA
jgi:tetratricopeptide (TPR) repeat protein